MALSGNQLTGLGATGFPNRAYLGFTAKTESITLEIIDGLISSMTADGFGTTGIMTADGTGIASIIENSGIISTVTDYGGYALSTINDEGNGIDSTM